MSWRDEASDEALADMDGLLNLAIPFAQDMLAKHGAFYPYGAVVTHNGEERLIPVQVGSDQPQPVEVIEQLYHSMKAHSPSIRAAAVVADVSLPNEGNGVRIDLEHRDGVALALVLPYVLHNGAVDYGELTAGQANQRIWGYSGQ
jgi:hypothetical protein